MALVENSIHVCVGDRTYEIPIVKTATGIIGPVQEDLPEAVKKVMEVRLHRVIDPAGQTSLQRILRRMGEYTPLRLDDGSMADIID